MAKKEKFDRAGYTAITSSSSEGFEERFVNALLGNTKLELDSEHVFRGAESERVLAVYV